MEDKNFVVLDENGNPIEKSFWDKTKEKLKEAVPKIKKGAGECWTWLKDNREELVKFTPFVLGAIGLVKSVKPTATQTERQRIDHTYYDPRTGLHWQLRRPLTNTERMELERRRRLGEDAGSILADMRVLY